MRTTLLLLACNALLSPIARADDGPAKQLQHWPQWRGPLGTGVAPDARPPLKWDEATNIRWKVDLGGRAHSSPIIWADRVYVQTAVPKGDAGENSRPVHQFGLRAIERQTGKTIWHTTLTESVPHERGHDTASHASNSPITDGEHIYAYFGSRGLHCVNLAGKVVWKKDLGQMQTRREFGEGSSPALHGDTLVIVWDHEGEDFIVALDKRTGRELWRQPRDELTAWATPVILEDGNTMQVVANATGAVRSYDLTTGKLLWSCTGMTQNVIPTPVHADGILYLTSGFRGNALLAVRYAGARGDLDGTPAIAWKYDGKGTPYVPSPVLHRGKLYFLSNNQARLSCLDARTGQAHYERERVGELKDVYASLVAADDRIYVVSRDGKTAVIAPGPNLKVLIVNELDDAFDASPAFVGQEMYLRGHKHLYCIAAE